MERRVMLAFGFATGIGGTADDAGQAMTTDAAGNVYCTGYFSGTANFGGVSLTSSGGSFDVFVAKYSATGTLQWARSLGGSDDDRGFGIAVSPADGSVYTIGSFAGTADFNPSSTATSNLTSFGGYDIFVCKLDNSGNFGWVRQLAGAGEDRARAIALGSDGNIYTAGYFSESADFDPGTGLLDQYVLTSAGGYDAYVAKLSSSGSFIWARQIGSTGNDYAYGLAVTPDTRVYTTGSFTGTVDFNPGTGVNNLTSSGGQDVFVSALNTSGGLQWARNMGGTGDDTAYGVDVSSDGSVYTAGRFWGTADFDPGVGICSLISAGSYDSFVSKLDASGNLQWGRRMGGTGYDGAYGLRVSADGCAYTTGFFWSTADFDPGGNAYNLTSRGSYDTFISRLDSSGDFAWAQQMGGTTSDMGNAISLSADASVYTTGSFTGTADLDPGSGTYNLTSQGGLDIFVSRVRQYSVGDRVWHEINLNGIQDAAETAGVAGVSVELYSSANGTVGDADDVLEGRALTDANGNYSIGKPEVGASNCYLIFRAPVGYTFTAQDIGSNDAVDSDASASGVTAMFTLGLGNDASRDAGLEGAAPSFGWALRVGSVNIDMGIDVVVDTAGNSYLTGEYSDAVDMDPGPGTYSLGIGEPRRGYVVKFSPKGALIWAHDTGGPNTALGVASDGSVYITGGYSYVAKYAATGNFIWGRSFFGSPGLGYTNNLTIASDGTVYTAGYFGGTVDFDPGTGTYNLTSKGSVDIFVSTLDASGNFVWARSMGGTSNEQAIALAVASDGAVYTAGYFQGTSDFDPGTATYNLTSAGSGDIFVSKLDVSGNFVWARQMGGTDSAIAVDLFLAAEGSVYTTGMFKGTADFDPSDGGAYNLTSAGKDDIFVSKLDASGNFVWARSMGGASDDCVCDVAVAPDGSVYTSGYFYQTSDFDPGSGTYNLTAWRDPSTPLMLYKDIFVSKLDASGDFLWARSICGTDDDLAAGLEVASDGSVYIAGTFLGTADFDLGRGTYNLTTAGGPDFFLSKLKISPHTLGDRVWKDANQNGVQDTGELGVAGVGVELYSSIDAIIGNADDVLEAQAVTDASGNFTISGVFGDQASYYLAFRAPVGYTFTGQDLGGNDNTDSDADSTGVTALFTLAPDANNLTLDAGLVGAAPGFGWALRAGSTDWDAGETVATDAAGNVYVAGSFSETVDFDPGPGVCNLVCLGSTGAFVAKYSPAGALLWARKFTGPANHTNPTGIGLATDGSVFIAGSFSGTTDFDPGSGTYALTSAGGDDIFVAKLDASGNLVWARRAGAAASETSGGIAVAGDGSVYTAGAFSGTVNFNPAGTANLTSAGIDDIFVWKLDAAGAYVWAQAMGGAADDCAYGIALADDGVYTTGYFHGTADFDPGTNTANLVASGGMDIFVSKLDPATGGYLWAKRMGGLSDEYGRGIAVSADGSGVFTTGAFAGTVDFNPGSGPFYIYNLTSASPNYDDIFVSKLNRFGDFVWATRMGGTAEDSGWEIAAAADGSAWVTGSFSNAANFDPAASGFALTASSALSDVFVCQLNPSGGFNGARRMGGNDYDYGYSIALSVDGGIYTTGSFGLTADFDPSSGTYNLTSAGTSFGDMFLSRLLPLTAPTDIALSSYSVVEQVTGTRPVATLTAADSDWGESFTYALVAGAGDADNALFTIAGDTLQTSAVFDYETRSSYSIRVSVTDQGGLRYEKALAISVTDCITVGNRVWKDLDLDGIQDPGEPGLAHVGVEVYTSADGLVGNDVLVARAVTDAAGAYLATEAVPVGMKYYVVFRAPVGYSFTGQDQGGNDATDSDADSTGVTGMLTAASGASDLDRDAGMTGAAPGFGWAIRLGIPYIDEYVGEIRVDAAGNPNLTGIIPSGAPVDFDPGPGVYQPFGTFDLAQYSSGGALIGGRRIESYENGYPYVWNSEVAPDGSIYIAGEFTDVADVDPTAGTYNLTSAGGYDTYVAKLDASGNFLWARSMGGPSDDEPGALAVAPDGSVYCTGWFDGTAAFGGVNLTSSGGSIDAFVVKLSPNGTTLWAKAMGGTALDQGLDVAVSPVDGSVCIAGMFWGTADFDPGNDISNRTSAGNSDVFVSKLDASGNFLWAQPIGGTGRERINHGLAVAPDGSIYIAGVFSNTVDFDPGPGTFNLTSVWGRSVFICKLSGSDQLIWAGSVGDTSYIEPRSLAVAADGSAYLGGHFADTVDFDPSSGTFNLTSFGAYDMFLCKFQLASPTNMILSSSTVGENVTGTRRVGDFTTVDSDEGDTFTYSLASGAGDADNALFSITGNTLQTSAVFDYETRSSYSIRVRVTDYIGLWYEKTFTITVVPTAVVGRYAFYNRSAFDGNDPLANSADDAAIATNPDGSLKTALLPGQTATFANYTSYSRGLNGLMLDVAYLANGGASLSAADFLFTAGNSTTPSAWTAAPAPSILTIRPGAGVNGSDRITLIWPDNAIQKQWLQITVLANANTGLAASDLFYFGNAIGESGNSSASAAVDAADELLARANGTGLGTAAITNAYDYNRDRRVNATDQLIARSNRSGLTPLKLITAPAAAPAAPAAVPVASTPLTAAMLTQSVVTGSSSPPASGDSGSSLPVAPDVTAPATAVAPSLTPSVPVTVFSSVLVAARPQPIPVLAPLATTSPFAMTPIGLNRELLAPMTDVLR